MEIPFALASVAAHATPVARRLMTPGILRVMTLNVAHGARAALPPAFYRRVTIERNLRAIAQAVREEQPDVVAMQEVDRNSFWSGRIDHVAWIGRESGYENAFFGAHHDVDRRPWVMHHGTALLSVLPLENSASRAFATGWPDDKGFVAATLKVPAFHGKEVDVLSVHLDPFSENCRRAQVAMIVDTISRRPPRSLVVMGDLNASWAQGKGAVGMLAKELGIRPWLGEGAGPTYPACSPLRRIDWILLSPDLEVASYGTPDAIVSDHRGVKAEIRLARPDYGAI